MGSQPSTQGDMYSLGIMILEILTKRRPTQDMFKDDHNFQTYVKDTFPDILFEVVSLTILPLEFEVVNIMQLHPNVEKCLLALFKIGLTCSLESAHERMNAIDVLKELNYIKNFSPLW